jgi:L-ascorbate metabolism protein UlaG (beta-lactamase superfamily)
VSSGVSISSLIVTLTGGSGGREPTTYRHPPSVQYRLDPGQQDFAHTSLAPRTGRPPPMITHMTRHSREAQLRLERMHASPRFDGRVFRNTSNARIGLKPGTAVPTMKEYLCGGVRRVPGAPIPVHDPRITWGRSPETGLRVTWFGHSSLLFEIDGARVLVDPVWTQRASPVPFAGPKRFHAPPVPIGALPALDAVLISHDHYDHLDRVAIRALSKRPVRFITSLGVGAHLEAWGVAPERITELDWWEEARLEPSGVVVTAAPSQHFSGRTLLDRNATAWSSFHLQGARHSVFHGADTGLTSEYHDIRERFGTFDLVLLEIGAWHSAWGDIHLGPVHALDAHAMLGSGRLMPIHWGTFNLAMHAWDEPIETLSAHASTRDISLITPQVGQPVEPARIEGTLAWWRDVVAEERARGKTAAVPEIGDDTSSVNWPID